MSLGRLVAVHPVAPAAIQRAVFITVLSFLFFLGMMFAYYQRGDIGYFLLSTAFLLLYLAMMFAVLRQRKSTVEVYERGLRYRSDAIPFERIAAISDRGELTLTDRRTVRLPTSVNDFARLLNMIRDKIS